MQVHYDIHALPQFKQAVITIGAFDGVHTGHRKIIRQVIKLAESVRGESVVITFHPHPRKMLDAANSEFKLLNTLAEKIALLEETGIDHLVVVPFTLDFAQLSPDEYIDNFLIARFRPRYIVLGFNHRFGANRQGDIRYLRWKGPLFGYQVVQVPGVQLADEFVSSSRIRKLIKEGNITQANHFLGSYYRLTGTVIKGDQIGRTIGFPTANIQIEDDGKLLPLDGIYSAWVHWNGDKYKAMLYIGRKPTVVKSPDQRVIEVHILQFNEHIYGQTLVVEIQQYIRGDLTFPDKEALRDQIYMDRKKILISLDNAEKEQTSRNVLIGEEEIAAVILNYNGLTHLKQYLPEILRACKSANVNCHIIDNCSTDGSQAWILAHHPNVQLIELDKNYGYAGGYNHGLLHIEAKNYFLINSDVTFHADVLIALRDFMDTHAEVAACQPKIIDDRQRDRFEYAGGAGGWIDFLGYPFCRGRVFDTTEQDHGQYDKPAEIFWASGAAFMIRSHLFHQFGGFDPQYFAHLEEIDLCWRLKRAGYSIMAEPSVKVYHLGGGTLAYDTPRKVYLNFRNSLITLAKNERVLDLVWKLPCRVILDFAAILLFLFQGKFQHILSVLRSLVDFVLTLPLTILKRRYHLETINKHRIKNKPNNKGIYFGSIVWEFFMNGRKTFSAIVK